MIRKLDPTQTSLIRKRFSDLLQNRVVRARNATARWLQGDKFQFAAMRPIDAQKNLYKEQLEKIFQLEFSDGSVSRYLTEAYKRGVSRAYDSINPTAAMDLSETMELGFRLGSIRGATNEENLKALINKANDDKWATLDATRSASLSRFVENAGLPSTPPDIEQLTTAVLKPFRTIALNRLSTLAQTEIVRAHSWGLLDGLRHLQIRQVRLDIEYTKERAITRNEEVEFVTAGDSRVCPLCRPLEGRIFDIRDAYAILPIHPRCRCSFLPVRRPTGVNPRLFSFDDGLENNNLDL